MVTGTELETARPPPGGEIEGAESGGNPAQSIRPNAAKENPWVLVRGNRSARRGEKAGRARQDMRDKELKCFKITTPGKQLARAIADHMVEHRNEVAGLKYTSNVVELVESWTT